MHLSLFHAGALMAKKKRDAAYYRARLKREFPTIFADLSAGRIKSVRQAAARAGLIQLPTRADALIRDWKRATPAERERFRDWLSRTRTGLTKVRQATDASGILKPAAVTYIEDWLRANGGTPGQIMKKLGFSNFDSRLAQSINRKTPLPAEVRHRLQAWLTKEGF
jgi:hypothetical protein